MINDKQRDELNELNELLDDDLIAEDEYEITKRKIETNKD